MLNLLCISASADGTDSAVFSDARRLLSALEIGDIQEDYNEALNTAVSRGEAVDAVMRCVIGGGITVSEAPYGDIYPGASYAPAVASAKAMGILSPGRDFRPDDTVTFEELSKIAVSAAGYAPEAEKNGGYPIGYTGTAGNGAFGTETRKRRGKLGGFCGNHFKSFKMLTHGSEKLRYIFTL